MNRAQKKFGSVNSILLKDTIFFFQNFPGLNETIERTVFVMLRRFEYSI